MIGIPPKPNGSFGVALRPAWTRKRYRATVAGPNIGTTFAPDAQVVINDAQAAGRLWSDSGRGGSLGRSGQLSLPRAVLKSRRCRLSEETMAPKRTLLALLGVALLGAGLAVAPRRLCPVPMTRSGTS